MIKFPRKVKVNNDETQVQEEDYSPKTSDHRFTVERRILEGHKAFGIVNRDWQEHHGFSSRKAAVEELEKCRANYYWGKTFEFRLVEWSD